jgi:hypothetical protein
MARSPDGELRMLSRRVSAAGCMNRYDMTHDAPNGDVLRSPLYEALSGSSVRSVCSTWDDRRLIFVARRVMA